MTATAVATKTKKVSNRLKVFRALGRRDLTMGQLYEAIGMRYGNGHMGILLRGEVAGKRIRTIEPDDEDQTSFVYALTALGRKHMADGKVDSYAREKGLVQLGRHWEIDTNIRNGVRIDRKNK